jgi:hypothetical protein
VAVRLQENLLASVEAEPGDLVLVVHADPAAKAEVRAAIDNAARSLGRLAHPEEPDGAWPNLALPDDCGAVPALRVDLKDRAAYPGVSALLVGVLVAALAATGTDSWIALPDEADVSTIAADIGDPAADPTATGGADGADLDSGAEFEGREMAEPSAHTDRRSPTYKDVQTFPWPTDWLPLVRQVGFREWETGVMVPRPAEQVVDELTEAINARGKLTGAGRIQRPPYPWVLLCELNGQGYLVSVIASQTDLTQLSLVTPVRWSDIPANERANAYQDAVWTLPPG